METKKISQMTQAHSYVSIDRILGVVACCGHILLRERTRLLFPINPSVIDCIRISSIQASSLNMVECVCLNWVDLETVYRFC
jgi:hypothetical protein